MSASGRILIVDDDESIRDVVDMALTEEGYEVAGAADGAVALDMIHHQHVQPDLILLDMWMPRMDGWEFARAYRDLPGPHAPIVVLTAARNAAERSAQINADGFLAKPFGLDELLQSVAEHTHMEK